MRACVKIEGMHKATDGPREWLPFCCDSTFMPGRTAIRMVHTIIFDGDQEQDFVAGSGCTFAVPLHEGLQNRHVRFAGDEGRRCGRADPGGWGQCHAGRASRFPPGELRFSRRRGRLCDLGAISSSAAEPRGIHDREADNPKSAWIFAVAGKRSAGLAFVGDLQAAWHQREKLLADVSGESRGH